MFDLRPILLQRAEKELTQQNEQQQWNGFVKEFHRVSCRFQRQNLKSFFGQSLGQTQKLPPTIPSQVLEKDSEETDITLQRQGEWNNNNNNVRNFQWDPSKVTSLGTKELAREFPYQPHPLLNEVRVFPSNRFYATLLQYKVLEKDVTQHSKCSTVRETFNVHEISLQFEFKARTHFDISLQTCNFQKECYVVHFIYVYLLFHYITFSF